MKPKHVHVVDSDGSYDKWVVHGIYHREDGPAYIRYDKNGEIVEKRWFWNSKLNREDGPAVIYYRNGKAVEKEWWIKGRRLKKYDTI